jgi:hypothetical protein
VRTLKRKNSYTLIVIFTAITIVSMLNISFAAENTSTQTETQTVSTASATGSGWFFCRGHRDGFSFSVMKGNSKPDGWNYAPAGYFSYQAKLPTVDIIGQANSMRIWRFKVDPIEGGMKAIVVGIAQVKIGQDVRNNWLFRISVRTMDNGENGFMIQLWRPIGADKTGGWSFGDFNPNRPATLKLNDAPFYQAQGILAGGTIKIEPTM